MSTVIITARDPLGAGDTTHPVRTAAALARSGEPVTLVLLEDAVTLTRLGHRDLEVLVGALDAGVHVLVEREARDRRGVEPIDGVADTTVDEVAGLLDADRSVWL